MVFLVSKYCSPRWSQRCLSSVCRVFPCTFWLRCWLNVTFLKNVILLLKLSVHISILVVLMQLVSIIMILLPAWVPQASGQFWFLEGFLRLSEDHFLALWVIAVPPMFSFLALLSHLFKNLTYVVLQAVLCSWLSQTLLLSKLYGNSCNPKTKNPLENLCYLHRSSLHCVIFKFLFLFWREESSHFISYSLWAYILSSSFRSTVLWIGRWTATL